MIECFVKDEHVYFGGFENQVIDYESNEFVEKMFESANYYKMMRNVRAERAKLDMFVGKKAEFLVARFLHEKFSLPLISPDMEIRKGRAKKWVCDLIYEGVNVHVKCCTASTVKWVQDFSWTFQWSNNTGKNGKDDIFDEMNDDYLALVYIENERVATGTVKGLVKIKDIKPLLKDPKKTTLIGVKKCLYYKDLSK